MPEITSEFDQLQEQLSSGGINALLATTAAQLKERKKYHELFEVLKMQVRQRLGLPLLYQDTGDELDEPVRDQLETGLLDACQEVGTLLLGEAKVREGWMYLRPVGNQAEVARQLAKIEPNEDNLEELVEVMLHEGVDPARGYALVLENYGTCNAITTYESSMSRHSKPHQQATASLLVEHVHRDLLASVVADITQQQGQEPTETTLRELVADRDWLFGEHSYHLDTTHLASTVRFARILDDEKMLRLALDLTAYGGRLSPQFQYPGEGPFEDLYPSHALYLAALLGEQVDEAIAYFATRAETMDAAEHGALPLEAYVQLLDRLGRHEAATETLIRSCDSDAVQASQVVPLLVDLAGKSGKFEPLIDFCRQREDVLGFATALAQASLAAE